MLLDVLGLLSACSYALDCVEAELVHVSDKHAKRVAYMSVCMAEQLGINGESLQDLAACALLHDTALTQYIQEELHKDVANVPQASQVGIHCTLGEKNIQRLPFHTDVKNVILYHHENANGSGPFGKTWEEVPIFSRIIHLSDLLDRAYGAKGFTKMKEPLWTKNVWMLSCRRFPCRIFWHWERIALRKICGRKSPASNRS